MTSKGEFDVDFQDQKNINKFSRINLRRKEIIEKLKQLEKSAQETKNAKDDLDTVLEDDVDVQMGKCFLVMTTDKALSSMSKEFK